MRLVLISLIFCIALSSAAIDLRGYDPNFAKNLSAQNTLSGWQDNELPDLGHYCSGMRAEVQDAGPTEVYLVQFANNETTLSESILNTTSE
jgi:hypothetical protein